MTEKNKALHNRTYQALCDIFKDNDTVICKMEMPGVSKENLDIKVNGDRLIINGKKQISQQKGEYWIREIKDRDYYHEFTIDDTADCNKIEASIKNGVVTLTLGIKESIKPRKITVVSA